MNGRTPTKKEVWHMSKAQDFGCCICRWYLGVNTPAAIHHIDGQRKEGAHLLSLPLCHRHHQLKDNNKPRRWVSRHGDGRRAFEQAYDCEYVLLERLTSEYCAG